MYLLLLFVGNLNSHKTEGGLKSSGDKRSSRLSNLTVFFVCKTGGYAHLRIEKICRVNYHEIFIRTFVNLHGNASFAKPKITKLRRSTKLIDTFFWRNVMWKGRNNVISTFLITPSEFSA